MARHGAAERQRGVWKRILSSHYCAVHEDASEEAVV